MGTYRGGKNTTSQHRTLDVRWLHREGFLNTGRSSTVTWSRRGEVVSSIRVCGQAGSVWLEYQHQPHNGEWNNQSYTVSIDWTRCNYGGMRPWFLCPARGCGRRVAVLYSGRIFACRHCYRLAYESQHEPPYGRALRKAQAIREKLGGSSNMGEHFPEKPKWMHWSTYNRLCQQYEYVANLSWPPWMLRMLS